MTDNDDWFERALPRYFEGDLDRIEAARFDELIERDSARAERFAEAWDERAAQLGILVLQPSADELADCFSYETLSRYATGDLEPEERRLVDAHFGCPLCRDQVEALRPTDAEARPPSWTTRLAEFLNPTRSSGFTAAAAMAAAVAAIIIVTRAPDRSPDEGFTGRGGTTTVFDRVRAEFIADGESIRTGDTIARDARVGLRYTNAAPRALNLLAFGIGEGGQTYWYYPAWTDAADDPRAVPLDAQRKDALMPDVVRHDLKPGLLRLVAVFTPDRLSVRAIEARIDDWRRSGGQLAGPGPIAVDDEGRETSIVVTVTE